MGPWKFWIALLFPLLLLSCGEKPSTTRSGLKTNNFHTLVEGKATELYVLSNNNGMEVCVTNYGARIVSIMVPNKKGKFQDIVLGFDSIGGYLLHPSDLGAIVGRFAGGVHSKKMNYHPVKDPSELKDNDNQGFQNKVFDAQQLGSSKLVLTYISKDGEDGFPGNLICSITYNVTADNSLDISFDAGTDRSSLINISNFIYFNLSGNPSYPCTNDQLSITAKNFLPINSKKTPMAKTAKAIGTPLDFHRPTVIDKNIHKGNNTQLKNGNGFNHCYLLNNKEDISHICATLYSPQSGIMMNLFTSEPILFFYSGNQLDGTLIGKRKTVYNQHSGIVLAPQGYPDIPDRPSSWPSNILKPGQKYKWRAIYHFSTIK
jgi:aldose 1-epimerase